MRTPFLSVGLFLAINGWKLAANAVEATQIMFGVAADDLEEDAFAQWIRDHLVER